MNTSYGPYSPIRQAGSMYFTSGQLGIKSSDKKDTNNDIVSQTNQALNNLKAVLASRDLSLDDVVKTTVYLPNMSDFLDMNTVYERYFSHPRPARSTVGVKALPLVIEGVAALVEIEAIAYKEVRNG